MKDGVEILNWVEEQLFSWIDEASGLNAYGGVSTKNETQSCFGLYGDWINLILNRWKLWEENKLLENLVHKAVASFLPLMRSGWILNMYK